MNKHLIAKEVRENLWVILIVFFVLILILIVLPYTYKSMFPILISQQINYEKFLWYDWFTKALPQITLVAAIIMGASSIARETRNGTVGYLITRPVSRQWILAHKTGAGAGVLLAIMGFTTLLLVLFSESTGVDTGRWILYLLGFVGDALLIVPVYLLAMNLSILLSGGVKAGLLTAIAVVVLYGPAWLGSDFSVISRLFGDFGSLHPLCAGLLLLGDILLFLTASAIFGKKEL